MTELQNYNTGGTTPLFSNKKMLRNLAIMVVLILALPLAVYLVRQQQIIKSRAAVDPITFSGANVVSKNGQFVALKPQVTVDITSPLGPPTVENGYGQNIEGSQNREEGFPAQYKNYLPQGLVKEVYAASCTLGPKSTSPDLGATCTACIAADKAGDVNYIKNQGNAACSNQQVVNYMCNGGISPENQAGCIQSKNTTCAGSCGGGPATCSLGPKSASPDLGATCTACIASNKSGDVSYIKSQGHNDCSNQQVVNYMCNGGISPENQAGCNQAKTGICASSCGGTPGGKDNSGPATACNVNVSYSSKPDLYALWDGKCDGKKQAAGSGIGQTCCELACGAASSCDEQTAGQGNCDANCQVPGASTPPGSNPPKPPTSNPPGPKPPTSNPPAGSPIATAKPSAFTTHYRIADNTDDLQKAPWETYKQPLTRSWEFKDQQPGTKTIYVEFQDTAGKVGGCGANKSQPCSKQIRLAGSGPTIIGCSLSSEGQNTLVTITGTNFTNSRGALESEGNLLQIRQWQDSTVTATGNMPANQTASITLTNGDGQVTEGQCSTTSLLSLGARLLCSASALSDLSNADLAVAGIFEGGKLVKQKVTIKKDGTVVGLTEKLQSGKKYRLSVKAPKSLRKTSDAFTAGTGATNIPNFLLPVGDIFPAGDDDGVINALDKAELNRQWIISGNAANRSGDLNGDGRVNSIDWACMRYGFGRSDEAEPVPGAEAGPSQSPSSSLNPSASESPTPGVTASPGVTVSPGVTASPGTSPRSSASPGASSNPGGGTHASSSPYSFPSPSSGGWGSGWLW